MRKNLSALAAVAALALAAVPARAELDARFEGFAAYGRGPNRGYGEASLTLGWEETFGATIEAHKWSDFELDEYYLWLQFAGGRYEMGHARNIAYKTAVGAVDVGATQLHSGYLFMKGGSINSARITTDGAAPKASLASKVDNFTFGASYVPHAGEIDSETGGDGVSFKSGYVGAVKYDAGEFAISAGRALWTGFGPERRNFSEYSLGARYYARGLQLGGSYRRMEDFGYSFDYGVAYEMSAYELSLSNLSSRGEMALKADVSMLSAKMKMDGFSLMLSLGREAYPTLGETGTVGMLGVGVEL